MNIGIDIDGFLIDLQGFEIKYGTRFFKKKYGIEVVNPNGYTISDIFECTEEQQADFWEKHLYILLYAVFGQPREGTDKFIQFFKENSCKIFFITARAKTTEDSVAGELMRILVKYWLTVHRIKSTIVFCPYTDDEQYNSECKLSALNENHISIMFDDDVYNIKYLSKFLPLFYYETVYNKGITGNNIFSFSSFLDSKLYSTLKEIINSKEKIENKTVQISKNSSFQKEKEKTDAFYQRGKKIIIPTFNKIYHPEVIGESNIPKEGPAILFGNHIHKLDQYSIIGSTDRVINWLAKKEYFEKKPMDAFYKKSGCIPVDREGLPVDAMKLSLDYLESGNLVGIFGEATRNRYQIAKNALNKIEYQLYCLDKDAETGLYPAKMIQIKRNRLCLERDKAIILVEKEKQFYKEQGIQVIENEEMLPLKEGSFLIAKKAKAPIVPFVIVGEYTPFKHNLKVIIDEPIDIRKMKVKEAAQVVRQKQLQRIREYNPYRQRS